MSEMIEIVGPFHATTRIPVSEYDRRKRARFMRSALAGAFNRRISDDPDAVIEMAGHRLGFDIGHAYTSSDDMVDAELAGDWIPSDADPRFLHAWREAVDEVMTVTIPMATSRMYLKGATA